MKTRFPLDPKVVEIAIDNAIRNIESKENPNSSDFVALLRFKEVLYEALDAGRIARADFTKSMCKLSAAYYRFCDKFPLTIVRREDMK